MAKKVVNPKTGGIVFYTSLVTLLFLAGHNAFLLPVLLLAEVKSGYRLVEFLIGNAFGCWFASMFINGHLAVLLHETKHSVFSSLVGNKAKKMKIKKETGSFEYSYTKDTKAYNAFIALAPYWMPLFTLPTVGAIALLVGQPSLTSLFVVGAAYGADTFLNVRDIHRRQTDIINIRGGYMFGLLYIIAMNLALLTMLLAWVMQGYLGLKLLLYGLWKLVVGIVAYYQHKL
jgi:hypothetical protein